MLKLAGLSLLERSSGITQGQRHRSKRGKPTLRKAAFMFALRSVRKDGLYRADYERLLRNNGGVKLAALGAISRKALKLMFRVARECRAYVPADEWDAKTGCRITHVRTTSTRSESSTR